MKILIIDDARWQRGVLTKILSEAGHEVIEASDGREGIARVSEELGAIICDLLMPNLDGFGFLAELRKRGSHVPVVIASADIQRTSRERCHELGATRFIPKPYNAAMLLKAIAEATSPDAVPQC